MLIDAEKLRPDPVAVSSIVDSVLERTREEALLILGELDDIHRQLSDACVHAAHEGQPAEFVRELYQQFLEVGAAITILRRAR